VGAVRADARSLDALELGTRLPSFLDDAASGEARERVVDRSKLRPRQLERRPSTSRRPWGSAARRPFADTLELIEVELITPNRHKLGERPPAELAKARIRLVIESVFSNLKRQMRLEDHLAKTLPGLAQRIVQRLLALTLGMLINQLTGRAARALVAYDGRWTHINPLGDFAAQ
jgi:hypothetical protein